MTGTFLLTMTSIWVTLTTINPIKIARGLLAARVFMAMTIQITLGIRWMPIIYILLFTGGILITFIILSSLIPNEKFSIKIISPALILTATILTYGQKHKSTQIEPPILIKWTAERHYTSLFVIALVLAYFLAFLNVTYSDKTPLQSRTCQK